MHNAMMYINRVFPDAVAFSLKDIQVRNFALSDPVAFLGQTDRPLFIDEIQKAPALIEYIQGIVDNHPERKFLLSGSSQFEMMRGVSESLAGRSGVYELMPMSFSETREISARKDMDFCSTGSIRRCVPEKTSRVSTILPM